MKFRINNTEWTIKEVDGANINNETKQDGTLGVTIYKTQEILLLEDQANIVKTLKHELMHVWLYEYGHAQDENTTYGYEDICEIVASCNDFINQIVNQYLGIEPLYLCDKEKNAECNKKNCDVCILTNNREYAKKKSKKVYNNESSCKSEKNR